MRLHFECPLWRLDIDTDKPFREERNVSGDYDVADPDQEPRGPVAFGFQPDGDR